MHSVFLSFLFLPQDFQHLIWFQILSCANFLLGFYRPKFFGIRLFQKQQWLDYKNKNYSDWLMMKQQPNLVRCQTVFFGHFFAEIRCFLNFHLTILNPVHLLDFSAFQIRAFVWHHLFSILRCNLQNILLFRLRIIQ